MKDYGVHILAMQKNPKISVIIPIYNAERYIDRCMQCIYAQTFTDYEIIMVNDGSKDSSAEICHKYKEKDSRVTFIDKKNEGAGSARNAGIEVAHGDYLAFPDVDDWFEPTMYEDLYEVAQSGNYDVIFSGANFYSQNSNDELEYLRTANCDAVAYTSLEECRKNVMHFFPTSTIFDVPWNKLYKRSVVIEQNIRFSDTRRCQDAMFNIDFYNAIQSAASVDKAYYNYIENTLEGVQRKFPKNYIDINFAYYQKLMGILTSWGMYDGEIKRHYDTSLVIAVFESLQMFDNPLWKWTRIEKKSYVKDNMARSDLFDFLQKADVREDEQWKAEILMKRDYAAFMNNYRKEKIKDYIRRTPIIDVYRRMRNTK